MDGGGRVVGDEEHSVGAEGDRADRAERRRSRAANPGRSRRPSFLPVLPARCVILRTAADDRRGRIRPQPATRSGRFTTMSTRVRKSRRIAPRRLACAVAAALASLTCMLPASAGAAATDTPAANTLDWQSCSNSQFDRWKQVDGNDLDGFDCSTFVRPLDRSEANGKQVQLAVVKLPATGTASQHVGTLFLNPGGPGQSGVGLSKLVYLLPESVRAGFDFVTYDPRGIGASTPALAGPRLQHPQAHPTGDGDGATGRRCSPRASSRSRAPTRAASTRTATWSSTVAASTAPTTSTRSARPSVTTSSPTGASRTARCSGPPTRRPSPIACARWCSTPTSTRRPPSPGSPRDPWHRTTRSASSSRPPACARSSTR